MRMPRWWRRARPESGTAAVPPSPAGIEVRIAAPLFASVRLHVEDFSRGEEAGFLICSPSRLAGRDVLIAWDWLPVPEDEIRRGHEGSVLSWSSAFNSDVLARALDENAVPVLVHSHGHPGPAFSADDRKKEQRLFSTFSRLLGRRPTGTLLLGDGDAVGSFWAEGTRHLDLLRLVIVGAPIEVWPAVASATSSHRTRGRLDRQNSALGSGSDARLAGSTVGVLGISGGGTHVLQQLVHQGVGTLIVVDDDVVEESNLGRMVGATTADIGVTPKVELARRIAASVDPAIDVVAVRERFPSTASIAALKEADVIVACLDRFDARESVNAFCRRQMIPLVDVGMTIRTRDGRLELADGQVIVTLPGGPCMRCWFLTDAVLAAERRDRPPGYDRNPDAPGDPQVVSMNGTLASEACNSVLDLITGYSGGRRGPGMWRYEGRAGALTPGPLPGHRPRCPACAEEGRADPDRLWK